ncbi:MAG: glycosyltransferase [Chitinophagaceae bacterium]|nr:glycosyltransferase [Chitinophagaceae bacterium]
MPKILRIINRLNLGGPTFNAAYLSKFLAPEFETMLVAGMIDDTEESSAFITNEMGLKPVYIPEMYREIHPMKDRRAYLQLKQIMRDFRPDIVHTHAAKAGTLGRLAAAATHVPVIVHTFHGHVFHSYFPQWKTNLFIRIERYLAAKSTRIISISNKQKEELAGVYKICAPEKIEVIPLGFNLEKFTADIPAKRKKFRNHYLVDHEEVVIVIVGRLVPVKNHTLFLKGLQAVQSKTSKKVRAFIVGDGEERKNIENQAASLQLDFTDFSSQPKPALLTFTSWIKEVDEVYAGADIVTLTSRNEGTPVSLIEAQAAGKPIVTTDVGGITDIVVPGKNAFVVAANDEQAFAEKLLQLVEDDQLRNNMSAFNTASITSRFDYRRLVSETAVLYRRILEEASK